MKQKITLLLLFVNFITFSQVGINTTSPNATLDITASNTANPANNDGILIPKIDNFPITNPTTAQDGILVYVTGAGIPLKGFYYWDNAQSTWINIQGVKKIDDLLDGKSSAGGSAVFLGVQSGLSDDGTDNRNTGLGYQSLKANVGGIYNSAIGHRALLNTTGNYNSGFGGNALFSNTTGTLNTGVGVNSLYANTTGTRNLALGVNAMRYNTTGNYNTATGNRSLFNLTVGNKNNAIGYESMYSSTGAYRNTANGFRSLYSNLTGSFNTAIGYEAGYNSLGAYNVFLGYNSGYFENGSNKLYIENRNANADNALIYGEFGTDNTNTGNILRTNSQFQIGNPALTGYAFPITDGTTGQVLQTNGSGAIAWANPLTLGTDDQNLTGATLTGTTLQITIENGNATSVDLAPLQDGGAQKINDLLDGKSDNDGTQDGSSVFLGVNAGLNDDATDNRNIGVGYQSLFMNTSGMYNTATGYMALAYNTTGNGNVAIGSFSLLSCLASNWNTAIGSEALYSNSSGNSNVAVGNKSLYSNTGGIENTAIGSNSLFSNTTGFSNTANGYQALYYNTTGSGNTANGYQALYSNTTGVDNTANGYQALYYNTTGYNNNANGYKSLFSNTTGAANTANGISALYSNTIGNANTANGVFALPLNTIGSYNTATGYAALRFNTTGSYNTATGINALYSNTTGYNNTAIGYAASYGGNYNNSSSLGYNTVVSGSNMARIGNTAVSSIGGYANWSNVSDKRFKTNVKENVPGINFIKKLRPVTYNLDMEALARFNKTPDSLRLKDAERLKAKETQIGFIAQEVETAANEIGFNFHGVEKPKNPQSHYGLRYAEFVVPLVKAVQEQQIIIETLKEDAKIKDNEIKELRKELNQQKKNIETIIRLLNKDN